MAESRSLVTQDRPDTPSLPGLSSIDIPEEHLAVESRNPEFTAARFFKQKPEQYRAICTLLGEGVSHSAIAKALNVSRNTVAAIYGREHKSTPVEQSRIKACLEYGELAGLCRERAREMLLDEDQSWTAQGLGVLMGVAQDKAIALSGGIPVQVDVHVHRDALDDLIEAARRKMSLEAETRAAKGDPVASAIEVEAEVKADFQEDLEVPAARPAGKNGTQPAEAENTQEVH